MAKQRLLGLMACVAMGYFASPAQAEIQPATPSDLFEKLCVANNADMKAVAAGARALGFKPVAYPKANEFTEMVALARETGSGREVVAVAVGETEVSKKLSAKAATRTCSVTAPASTWDVRSYAQRWSGVAPSFAAEGTALYSYAQGPQGAVNVTDDDLPAFVAALNAGQLRTLAATTRGQHGALAWVILDPPNPPAVAPASHDADPFAPCAWKDIGKSLPRRLECPGDNGQRLSTRLKEDTPARAQGGDTASMLLMAIFYLAGPQGAHDPAAGMAWLRRATESGSVQADFNLGLAYDSGLAGSKDKAQAATWYRKAAEAGYPQAMINLAALQLMGNGVPKDEAGGVGWLRRAADLGSAEALFDLGQLNEAGLGVPENPLEAIRWYEQAAAKRDNGAMRRLGLIYADGIGVEKSDALALEWLTKSVQRTVNLTRIVNGMSFIMLDPRGQAQLLAKAEAGDARSALQFGLHYGDQKNAREYDPAKSAKFLKIAADQNSALAMSALGVLYAAGEGVARNDAEALRLLKAGALSTDADGFRLIEDFAEAPVT